jgi:OFA family oxalate/formate antiporter-like MFS transporter
MFLSSQYLAPPKPGWMPKGYKQRPVSAGERRTENDLAANEAVRTRRFYWLWLMLFINVTCGIAVISVASPMAQEVIGMTASQAAAMVGLIGLFNGGGRIVWAALSDYIGRANAYTAFFAIQIVAFFLLPKTSSALVFQGLLFLIMTCYGGGFSCIPAFIGDLFGTKQLAAIHGYTLTAWAAAGLAGPIFAAWLRQRTGNYSGTLSVSLVMFALALVISLLIRMEGREPGKKVPRPGKALPEFPGRIEERTFPAELSALSNVMDFISARAERAGLPAKAILRTQLAVEEAVANICHYAYLEEAAINLVNYPYHEPGSFVVRARNEESSFAVDLIDQGLAFNPRSFASLDPKTMLEDPDLKGLGIHLIRQITDEVRYNRADDKNVLTIIMKN